uniref:Conotoxin Cl6.4 n=1 Tax=Californiconus californicus TaxID=1736779 RepID=U64_CONCL
MTLTFLLVVALCMLTTCHTENYRDSQKVSPVRSIGKTQFARSLRLSERYCVPKSGLCTIFQPGKCCSGWCLIYRCT